MSVRAEQRAEQPRTSNAAAQAGWYPDPMGGGGERYWDGIAWSDHFTRPAPGTPASTAPSGAPAVEQVVVANPARPKGGMHPTVFVVLALIVAVGAFAGLSRGGSQDQGWGGETGRNLHAGFVAGCNQSAGGVVDCECAFTKISSTPPYNTPEGFMTLKDAVARYQSTRNPADVPPVFFEAVRACRKS